MTIRIPTVHLNGTSGDELLKDLTNVAAAVSRARALLNAAGPNARDYYVQGADAFGEAVAQHRRRDEALCDVAAELEAIAEGIAQQNDARRRRR